MGIAQAGLAFRPSSPVADIRTFVSNLCNETAIEIAHPDVGEFDIRNHTDVMVQVFGDTYFVCNHDVVWDILEFPYKDISQTHKFLGFPAHVVAFCHYESGGSYGYAFIEEGTRTRSRLQTVEAPNRSPLIEYGNPKDFEQRWLSADFYLEEDDCPIEEKQKIFYLGNRDIEVPEYFLTKRILDEALLESFGVCPWDTDIEPTYYFFRLTQAKIPWWKFW